MTGLIQLPPAASYLRRLGLKANPFPVAPDASRYFLTPSLEALVREVLFCIQQRKGFIVITGEVGLGKTTFSRYMVAQLRRANASVAFVFNSFLQDSQLVGQILHDFGLGSRSNSVRARIDELNAFFIRERRMGRHCVLFIDDAQNLSVSSLETIRLLSNLETNTEKLVQVVLLGQPELLELLERHSLRQLKSRVALCRELQPLSRDELARYIDYKLSVTTDGAPIAVTRSAVRTLHSASAGNLRKANMLLDRVMLDLVGSPDKVVESHNVRAAQRDLKSRRPIRRRWRDLVPARTIAPLVCVAALVVLLGGDALSRWLDSRADPAIRGASQPAPRVTLADARAAGAADAAVAAPGAADAGARGTPTVARYRLEVPDDERDARTLHMWLRFYGLQDFVGEFATALKADDFEQLTDTLRGTGYRVMRHVEKLPFETPPFPVLKRTGADGTPDHIVLWQPAAEAPVLLGRAGPAFVAWMQHRLASAGFYRGPIDGIVGPETTAALTSFQRRFGLETGARLDERGLFILQHLEPGR